MTSSTPLAPPVPRADLLALARRLELAEALAGVEYAATLRRTGVLADATSLAVGGGYATYAGPASPLTQAFALGLHGPLPASDLTRLEAFFHGRATAAVVELSSPADPSLERAFVARGYQVTERSVVLVGPPSDAPEPTRARAGVVVRRAAPAELGDLGKVVAAAADGGNATGELAPAIQGMFRMSTATGFVADLDGQRVGGGLLLVHRRVGILCAAGVLPRARGRGVHQALLEARLAAARALKCETVMIVSEPGSAAHRNAERCGFVVAYGRAKYQLTGS